MKNADFTYGTRGTTKQPQVQIINPDGRYQANNAEPVTILMALKHPIYNPDHRNNLQKKEYLNPKVATADGKPGVGPSDSIYRDPWGNPYIISLDIDGDGFTRDAFYCRAAVSKPKSGQTNALNGLTIPSNPRSDNYLYRGSVMIWSFGPDGKADPNIPSDEGVNQDNILSWR